MKKLDLKFSEYIKLKESDQYGNGTCIYCGERVNIRELECCHFIRRANGLTRYDKLNCHIGHMTCNRKDDQAQLRASMIKRFGIATVERLEELSRINNKWFDFELTEKYKYYCKQVNELKQTKMIRT